MENDAIETGLRRLSPVVIGFRRQGFELGSDLRNLIRVTRVCAAEASVFYQARILEALAAAGVELIGRRVSPSPFSNLSTLETAGVLPRNTVRLAGALRRLGNVVRHIQRPVRERELQLGMAATESWLRWFFCGFFVGPQLGNLEFGEWRDVLPVDELTAQAIKALEYDGAESSKLRELAAAPELLGEPTFPTLLAELFLSRGEYVLAEEVISNALARNPLDLGLLQMKGLTLSRWGRLDEAFPVLKQLSERYPDDEETIGIFAGLAKRHWQATEEMRWLKESANAYRMGWEKSGATNAYLGINAASMALWSGDESTALQLAEAVKGALIRRPVPMDTQNLVGTTNDVWDILTLAEAELMLGNHEEAQRLYSAVRDRFPGARGQLAVALGQAEHHLRFNGIESSFHSWVSDALLCYRDPI